MSETVLDRGKVNKYQYIKKYETAFLNPTP